MHANIYIFKTFRPGPNVAATFGSGPNIAAIFVLYTGQNMDATFGPRKDIIWHGGTEYGSHILSGRTKYGSHIWSRTKFGCHNRSAGQFISRTFCAVAARTPIAHRFSAHRMLSNQFTQHLKEKCTRFKCACTNM